MNQRHPVVGMGDGDGGCAAARLPVGPQVERESGRYMAGTHRTPADLGVGHSGEHAFW